MAARQRKSKKSKSGISSHAPAKGRATSYDVARLAGVSQSAVSRCYKPGASVSKKMRERVMEVARRLEYRPNAIARGLITRRSNLIAVIISSRLSFYYPEVLFQLTERLGAEGLRVLLFTVDSEAHGEVILEEVWQYQVDGVISASHLSLAQYKQFEKRVIPVVFFNRYFDAYSTNVVWCDARPQTAGLVGRLVELGHQDFGLIHGREGNMVGRERMRAVVHELQARGIRTIREARGNFSYESGAAGLQSLIKGHDIPTAVICANDMMALGCMDEARNVLGLKVPEDVSITGFDGVAMARFSSYELTTIRQPIRRMADAAVTILVGRIGDKSLTNERRVFEGRLIEGRSVGPAKRRNVLVASGADNAHGVAQDELARK